MTIAKFALAYGFRNIQNVVRKIKQNKSPYAYVEMMACPSGCINGGGQIKVSSYEGRLQENAELVARVKDIMNGIPVIRAEGDVTLAAKLDSDWWKT